MAGSKDVTIGSQPPMYAGVVQVTVTHQKNSRVFYVAQNLLKSKAPNFMRTVEPERHAQRSTIQLADVPVSVFAIFVRWLEHEASEDFDFRSEDFMNTPFSFWAGRWLRLLQTYVFGDNYGLDEFRDQVLRKISEEAGLGKQWFYPGIGTPYSLSRWADCEHVFYVYETTPIHSPLRSIMVDLFCAVDTVMTNDPGLLMRYPKEFLVDVVIKRASMASTGQEHSTGHEKKRKMRN